MVGDKRGKLLWIEARGNAVIWLCLW